MTTPITLQDQINYVKYSADKAFTLGERLDLQHDLYKLVSLLERLERCYALQAER